MRKNERRSSERVSYVCEVDCEAAGVSRHSTRITDLSALGAFVESVSSLPTGTILSLRFELQGHEMSPMAEVRYSMSHIGMGVRFIDLPPEQRAVLLDYVAGRPIPNPQASIGEQVSDRLRASAPRTLLGSFRDLSPYDVVQMIESSKLTGSLAIDLGDARGEISFNDGLIVGARLLDCSVKEALSRFLLATDGSFEFRKADRHFEPLIATSSNTALLLDIVTPTDDEVEIS